MTTRCFLNLCNLSIPPTTLETAALNLFQALNQNTTDSRGRFISWSVNYVFFVVNARKLSKKHYRDFTSATKHDSGLRFDAGMRRTAHRALSYTRLARGATQRQIITFVPHVNVVNLATRESSF